ncbi:MAG: YdcF family protein [Bacteroidales bacterium]|nr:YdcF family protein [Bacteroidales bacterium]
MKLFLKKIIRRLPRIINRLLIFTGIIFLMMLVFALTSGPFWLHYRLGSKNSSFTFEPDYIILMGGSGMPSESNLIRAYYAAEIGNSFPKAPIIVALPGDTTDSLSSAIQLTGELLLRGINKERIMFEPEGTNTRSQALQIVKKLPSADSVKLVVVTSPEHTRRSILCFKKEGFKAIGGYPAYEYAIEADLKERKSDPGGSKFVPEVNESIAIRYRFWEYFKLEIIVLREYCALLFYKIKGWI